MLIIDQTIKITKTKNAIIILIVTSAAIVFITSRITKLFIAFEISIVPTIILLIKIGSYPERASANMYIITITIVRSIPIMMIVIKLTKESKSNMETVKKKIDKKEEMINLILISIFLAKLPIYALHI